MSSATACEATRAAATASRASRSSSANLPRPSPSSAFTGWPPTTRLKTPTHDVNARALGHRCRHDVRRLFWTGRCRVRPADAVRFRPGCAIAPTPMDIAPFNVLCIEDTLAYFLLIERTLRLAGLLGHCERVDGSEALTAALAERRWDLVLSDYAVPGM